MGIRGKNCRAGSAARSVPERESRVLVYSYLFSVPAAIILGDRASGVAAKIQSAFQLGRRCVGTSGDVINDNFTNNANSRT